MNTGIPLLPNFLARGVERWAAKRLPAKTRQTCLERRRIYILPTRNGMIFSLVLLVILLGAMNYQNSMAYLLTFLMMSISLLGMIATHQNLNHLCIVIQHAPAVFAGQDAQFIASLSSNKQREHIHIQLQCPEQTAVAAHLTKSQSVVRIGIPVKATQRGYLSLPRVRVFTEFPLGIFYAWSWIELDAQCLVYPAPAEHPPAMDYKGEQTGDKRSEKTGDDDFSGIRNYQHGDSPKRMAWKSIARSGVWQTKIFHADVSDEIWIRWQSLPESLNIEQRLSILCRRVLDAQRSGLKYGLEIPGCQLQPGNGQQHQHQCLKSLALYSL